MGCRERRWNGPSFPASAAGRKRVVIEGGDGAERWLLARAFAEAGFDVARRAGPIENGGPCPLVAGRGCDAVESADAVVNLLGLRSRACEDVLRAVREVAPRAALVAQATAVDRGASEPVLAETACAVVSPRAPAEEIIQLSRSTTSRSL